MSDSPSSLFSRMSARRVRLLVFVLACWWLPAIALAGSWQNNVSIGGFNAVNIYTPDSVSAVGNGRSLLVVLHGCTQPISAYLTARLEVAAEAHGMVVAVPDAMNKAGFSCWSYWQGAVARNSGDYRNLIQLAQALAADPVRNIDAEQIYLAGLSSGAAFAMQTACLAPDIFAGVASSAGPSIGTSSSGAISTCETVSATVFESRCRSYAGSAYQAHLATQVAVIAHGTADTTVNTCYNEQNANGFARVYGVSALPGSIAISEGTRSAEQRRWQDDRVAMLWLNGLAHAWSGGEGASGSFIGNQSINLASFLGGHFALANRRVDRNQAPQIDTLHATVAGNTVIVSGSASDPDGSVAQVRVLVAQAQPPGALVQGIETVVDGAGAFSVTSQPLAEGLYEITAHAVDDQALAGPQQSLIQRIGDPPPAQPPILFGIGVAVDGQCATVSGSVVDPNQDAVTVQIVFAQGDMPIATVPAAVDASFYAGTRCALPGGDIQATVTATDSTGLQATDQFTFTIDAGQTGDVQFHIAQGHISWGFGYAPCYLAFGNASFTMRESSTSGGQCVWTADGAANCQGPAQACQGGNGGGTPDPEPEPEPPTCVQHTAMNYLHKSAGRAYSTGLVWAPNYFAQGSDMPMAGSTYGVSTLSSSGSGQWSVGACPGD